MTSSSGEEEELRLGDSMSGAGSSATSSCDCSRALAADGIGDPGGERICALWGEEVQE